MAGLAAHVRAQSLVAWGNGGTAQNDVPAGLADVIGVSAGRYGTLALRIDGTVRAWGPNFAGESAVQENLTGVVAVAAGGYHSLALKSDGTVVAWGRNHDGESTVPPGLTGIVSISAGDYYSLALRNDGMVTAWGNNAEGQTVVPTGLSDVTAISAGAEHALALKSNGTVVAWGSNFRHQSTVPAGLTDVVAVAAGRVHSVALKRDGTVSAWGFAAGDLLAVPAGLTGVVAIAAGDDHTLALKSDGMVVTWGNDTNGQLLVPADLSGVGTIAAGATRSLALTGTAAGAPVIVGLRRAVTTGGYGGFCYRIQTAGPATAFSASGLPAGVELNAATGIISGTASQPGEFSVALGASNAAGTASATLALTVTGAPRFIGSTLPSLWMPGVRYPGAVFASGHPVITAEGLPPGVAVDPVLGTLTRGARDPGIYQVRFRFTNSFGFGEQTQAIEVSPVAVWGTTVAGQPPSGLTGVVSISAGLTHSLALKSDGTVAAWGANWRGPANIPEGLDRVVAVSAGAGFSLALKSDGTVTGWGDWTWDQLMFPENLGGVVAIAAGGLHSLALDRWGRVWAWGFSASGRTLVPDLKKVVAIAAGDSHSMALQHDGTVVAWGANDAGQTAVPAGLSGVVAIAAAGSDHCLALKADGTVAAWGANGDGQSTVPAGLTGVVAISAGAFHSLALKSDGSVVAWGRNADGQAIPPADLGGVAQIAAGYWHSLALAGPRLTKTVSAMALTGRPFSHQAACSLSGGSFTASTLPAGLTIDPADGLVSGTPETTGFSPVFVTCTRETGGVMQTERQLLFITILQNTYDNWRTMHLGGQPFPFATDHDDDGRLNLLEYVLGSDPLSPDAPYPLRPSRNAAGHLQVSADLIDSMDPDLEVTAQFADDLNFSTGLTEVTAAARTQAGAGMKTWTFTDPQAPSDHRTRFGRIRVSH